MLTRIILEIKIISLIWPEILLGFFNMEKINSIFIIQYFAK